MDAFELARRKYERNRLSQGRPLPKAEIEPEPVQVETVQAVKVPKVEAKPDAKDAVIDVSVTLPTGRFALRFTKADVLRNVQYPAKLNKNEFKNRLMEGLKPLLGAVNDVDRSGNEGLSP